MESNLNTHPPRESLPVSLTPLVSHDGYLALTYLNDAGTTVTHRSYTRRGRQLHERDVEYQFNFVTERWETLQTVTRSYTLAPDRRTLEGDGSGWDGAGHPWREWFKARHGARLKLRYPHDDIEAKLPTEVCEGMEIIGRDGEPNTRPVSKSDLESGVRG